MIDHRDFATSFQLLRNNVPTLTCKCMDSAAANHLERLNQVHKITPLLLYYLNLMSPAIKKMYVQRYKPSNSQFQSLALKNKGKRSQLFTVTKIRR